MKKTLLFFVVGLILFIVTGCVDNNGNQQPVDNPIEEINQIKEWITGEVPGFTNVNIELPTAHPQLGGEITWESFDENIITNDGIVTLQSGSRSVMFEYVLTYDDNTVTDYIVVVASAENLESIAESFAEQFSPIITRNYDVETDFDDNFTITWQSSHPEVFSNEGQYNKPVNNQDITITYTVASANDEETYTINLVVQGHTVSEKDQDIRNWINENYIPGRLITEAFQLPTTYDQYNAAITWSSSNSNVIAKDGTITYYPFDRYVLLTAEIDYPEGITSYINFDLIIQGKPVDTIEEKIDSVINAIALEEIDQMMFVGYNDITQSFNHLLFIENEPAVVNEWIIPADGEHARPGTKLQSIEFITIHDTANNSPTAGAYTHARIQNNGYSASWHISIDDTETYQSIPYDEVAYHAGDGRRFFELLDTGVTATIPYPTVTISYDGYYLFNGVKSILKAPMAGDRMPTTSDITSSGIYTEIGDNGNYLMNRSYFNTSYQLISNHGGNRNSIGFETSVNAGSDYTMTSRRTAQLVAELLITYDLGINRVMQHNHFSGKPCPLSLRRSNHWTRFLDMVAIEKYIKEELQGVDFEWTSLSPGILENNGKIAKDLGDTTEVNYQVQVAYNEQSFTRTFTTRITK